MFRSGFKVEKLKPYLKMSIQRIELLKNKKTNHIKQSKKLVAELLASGKEEKARIKTESIVREDFMIEAYEIIELLCELLLERVRLIAAEKECPYDMREAVCTLIYCSNRTEVKELEQVSQQLTKKYGKDFAEMARGNHENSVNERVVHKLSAQPPNAFLVLNYMKEIAKVHGIDWVPDEATEQQGGRFDVPMMAPTGATVGPGGGSGVAQPYEHTDGRIVAGGVVPTAQAVAPPQPSATVETPASGAAQDGGDAKESSMDEKFAASLGGGEAAATSGGDDNEDDGTVPDFDELSRRFNALKKR